MATEQEIRDWLRLNQDGYNNPEDFKIVDGIICSNSYKTTFVKLGLIEFPHPFGELDTFLCYGNNLKNFDNFPTKFRWINCSGNNFESLPEYLHPYILNDLGNHNRIGQINITLVSGGVITLDYSVYLRIQRELKLNELCLQ
jgi:hypothetical protein